MEFSENTFVSDHFWNHPQYRPLLLGTIGMLLLVMSYLVLPEDIVAHVQQSFSSATALADTATVTSVLNEATQAAADIVIDLKAPF